MFEKNFSPCLIKPAHTILINAVEGVPIESVVSQAIMYSMGEGVVCELRVGKEKILVDPKKITKQVIAFARVKPVVEGEPEEKHPDEVLQKK